MKCKEFWEKYEETGLTSEFEKHLEDCEGCRNEMKIELFLDKKAGSLPGFKAPEGVWEKIIQREGFGEDKVSIREKINNIIQSFIPPAGHFSLKPAVAGLAFVLLIAAGIGYYFNKPLSPEQKTRLQMEAVAELEETEMNYIAAIEKFSSLVEDNKENIDPELYQLYDEKLTVLDDYIEQCKDAIAQNQYNGNARKYLAIAYQEKVETLKQLSEMQAYF